MQSMYNTIPHLILNVQKSREISNMQYELNKF